MLPFNNTATFNLAAKAFFQEGATEYRGEARHAGRYIVGGIHTITVDTGLPEAEYARQCLNAAIDLESHETTNQAETMGVWVENGLAYFDTGDTYYTVEMALQVAQYRGELAIYDRVENVCIPVKR